MKAKFIDTDIFDAIEDAYLKEYSKGEYCHKQSFSWGFQEGVDWVLKQIGGKVVSDEPLKFELEEEVKPTYFY